MDAGSVGEGGYNWCLFGHVKFEMSIRHISGAVREVVGYVVPELRVTKAEIQSGRLSAYREFRKPWDFMRSLRESIYIT